MHFVMTSGQDVSIDGIGLLKGGEPRVISADELRMFEVMNKVALAKAKFPVFVSVVFDMTKEEVEDKP
jgi:hypothetical protein